MLQLDSVANLALTEEDVRALDPSRVSSPNAFRTFAKGIDLDEDFLLNPRWPQTQVEDSPHAVFDLIMHEMLPSVYDATYLERIGGQFGIRLTGVGDYTALAMNQRVVVLSGLPEDMKTGKELLDLEIAPDVFLAYARGLLLQISEEILEEDDEFEDREISDAELQFHGMPAGGTAFRGSIGYRGDTDGFQVQMVAGQTYQISLTGSQSGDGSLRDPYLRGIYDPDGNYIGRTTNDDGGDGLESLLTFTAPETGTFTVYAGAYGDNTGSYQLEVQPISTVFQQSSRIGYAGDTDDFEIEMLAGQTYQIDLSGRATGDGSLSDPYLRGIYDSEGNLIANTSNDDGGDGLNSHVTFTAEETGTFTIRAGASGDNTGTYQLEVNAISDSMPRQVFHTNDNIGYRGDTDDFQVEMEAGHTYLIDLSGDATGDGSLSDPYLRGIYDSEGNLIANTSNDDGGDGLNSQLMVTAVETGTYTVRAGAYGGSTGSYQLEVTEVGANEGLFNASVCGAAASAGSPCGGNASACGANASAGSPCGGNISACGTAASTGAACAANASSNGGALFVGGAFGVNLSTCGGNVVIGSVAGANASACGGNFVVGSVTGVNASACGANAAIVTACGANASACGANAAIGTACGANASACGANAAIGNGCGANANSCGGNFSLVGCGANASACGGNVSTCGADASACGVDASQTGASAVACGVDLAPGLDWGVCAVNIFPLLPSC